MSLCSSWQLAFFSQTLKRARSHPVVGKWLKKLTIEHETSPIDRVHMHHVILPWHRLALFLLETLIRKHIDCRFTVPYYDFTTHWQDWWRHPPWDAAHLGGNGRGKNCCVEDGPYREGQWSTIFPAGLPNTCLKRYFNRNYSQCSPNILSILFKLASSARDFRSFEMGLNHFAHDRIHHLVGAYMHFGTSINDPTFWVLHSFIDKVFTTWQAQGAEYLEYPYAHSAEVLDLQPASLNFTYADIHDNSNLPHNARVCYSSSHVTSCDGGKYFVPVRPGTAQWSLNKEISASELIYNLTNDETAQLHDVVTFLTDGRRVGASGASAEIRDMGWSDTLPGDCFEGVDADSILTALAEKAKANKPSRP